MPWFGKSFLSLFELHNRAVCGILSCLGYCCTTTSCILARGYDSESDQLKCPNGGSGILGFLEIQSRPNNNHIRDKHVRVCFLEKGRAATAAGDFDILTVHLHLIFSDEIEPDQANRALPLATSQGAGSQLRGQRTAAHRGPDDLEGCAVVVASES